MSNRNVLGVIVLGLGLASQPSTVYAQFEEVIVTAQKRAESAQDVPIAVTAFNAESLDAKQITGFQDIRFAAPNVTVSKGNFTATNFQIRGIGRNLVAASGDDGVSIHVNEVPLIVPRLYETEYFDVQAVEVLRGPQGTLYGRNATGGVVNMTTARASTQGLNGSVEGQYGDYDHKKLKGHINVPLGDRAAFRLAGLWLERDGYTENLYNGNDVDGRDTYSVRGSLALQPTDNTRIDLMVSYFEEDSNRSRSQKTMCANDPSGLLGCLPDALAFDLPNPSSQLTNILASDAILGPLGIFELGSNERGFNPNDVRKTYSEQDPEYYSDETLVTLNISHAFDQHTFDIVAGYQETVVDSQMDYLWSVDQNGIEIPGLFPLLFPESYATLFPDGKIGISAPGGNDNGSIAGRVRERVGGLEAYDNSNGSSEQYSLEVRMASDYDGMFNWLGGIFYLDDDQTSEYYVIASGFDYLAATGAQADGFGLVSPFFKSETSDYNIESIAIFGEVYLEFKDTLKLTLGARYSQDDKAIKDRQLLFNEAQALGQDSPNGTVSRDDDEEWQEYTGRAVLDWAVTKDSLVYVSFSRGYKPGGFNPPFDPLIFPDSTKTFEPEFVDAFEIGTKNIFFDGTLQANGSIFFYDYEDLQVSKIVNRTSFNENTNAEIYGVEAELAWAPNEHWLLNGNFAYLKAEAQDLQSIDTRDPTQGRDDVTLIKDITNASNCVALIDPEIFGAIAGSQFSSCSALEAAGIPITGGIDADLDGNQLQNSPEYSLSLGAQYTFYLPQDHSVDLRLDYYWQDEMYGRTFNRRSDKIDSWDVWNAQATLTSANQSWYARVYIKNIADDDHIVGQYITDPSSGLFTNVFAIEPRTYGIALGYNFN
jgi:outer membrane receptor protein involved in Fe transport